VDSRYDLVHCHLLLIHVSPVEVALRNMVRALRPGGWLIVEEPGDLKISAVGEDDPRVAEYNRLQEEFLASMRHDYIEGGSDFVPPPSKSNAGSRPVQSRW
jgi:SAM-dependent methyltransferase